MAAGIYPISIEQGATFYRKLQWTDSASVAINLTGYTAKMQLRSSPSDATVILELSTGDGLIVLTANTGTIELTIPASTTTSLTVKSAVYSLVLTAPSGFVT